ncbi:MAG TPA: hypothetical protein DEB10_10075 [Ruminococcaceae bacterium]|nr:hypothetical protein [Oscillospiraceae bacterium]
MKKFFEKISVLLDEQHRIHSKLLELENQKTGILLKGDITALDELVTMQQPYIMSSANNEKKREKLQREMGLDGLSLRQIIDDYPEARSLEKCFLELSAILKSLKKACAKNREILNAKVDVINCILSKAGALGDNVTYSNLKKA